MVTAVSALAAVEAGLTVPALAGLNSQVTGMLAEYCAWPPGLRVVTAPLIEIGVMRGTMIDLEPVPPCSVAVTVRDSSPLGMGLATVRVVDSAGLGAIVPPLVTDQFAVRLAAKTSWLPALSTKGGGSGVTEKEKDSTATTRPPGRRYSFDRLCDSNDGAVAVEKKQQY